MKTPLLLLASSVLLTGVACSVSEPPAAVPAAHVGEGDAAAHVHSGQTVALEPPGGRRWPTDEALRAAMSRIRGAVETAESVHRTGGLAAADRERLAAAVADDVAYMVANCKLEPDADAALHVLIGRMMSAASSLESGEPAEGALATLAGVLDDYGAGFDHPGWSAASR